MQATDAESPLAQASHWADQHGDLPFLTQPHSGGKLLNWTWAQALEDARRMAAYLESQKWEPETRIAILSRNCAWWIMADLAIWMAGHVSVPVYPSLRVSAIRQILEHSGAKACFIGAIDEKNLQTLTAGSEITWIAFPNAPEPTIANWDRLVIKYRPIARIAERPVNSLATIIYTSGTTGNPKGVMHRFGSLALDAKAIARQLGLVRPPRMLSYLPLAHVIERIGVEACAFLLGSHLFFTEGLDTFARDLRRARPTIFLTVPRLLTKFQQGILEKVPPAKMARILKLPGLRTIVRRRILSQLGLNRVRHAASGGASAGAALLVWFRGLGLPLFEGYGLTETLITHLPPPGNARLGCVGVALENVETKFGPSRDLLVRSPMNMMGYYRDPEATAASFTEDGFFRTGDICTIDEDGQTAIVGRTKEQFKTSKGKYVAPAPIESRLMEGTPIEACCLMGSGQPSPFAVVVLDERTRRDCTDLALRSNVEETLQNRLNEINMDLQPFERISMIVVAKTPWTVADGLLTPTLKIRRGQLEARYAKKIEDWQMQRRRVVWDGEHAANV